MTTKSLRKQLMAAIATLLVAAVALGSSTFAWFISNAAVTATTTNITTTSATPSLFIKTGKTVGTDFKVTDTQAMESGAALYPASTKNLTAWSAVSGWTDGQKANKFATATVTAPTSGAGAGTYSLFGKTYNAYNVATYTLYTNNAGSVSSVPVYVNGITVTDRNTTKNLQDVIRIGVKAGNNFFVYAPTAEGSTAGNGEGQAAGKYYAVDSGAQGELTLGTDIFDTTDLTDCDYVSTSTGSGNTLVYTAGAKALTTATTTGVQVEVYVWLEGTDGECTVGRADGLDSGLDVTVEFAGIMA